MTWGEFTSLLSGLMPETPLGAAVEIRSEKDAGKIQKFTPAQRRIYDNWQKKLLQENPHLYDEKLKQLEQIFLAFGKGANQNGT